MDHMRDVGGYSGSTQNQTLKAVASFFDANKLDFPTKELRRRRVSDGVLRIAGEGINEIYMYAMGQGWTKTRNRALYMFLKDSGVRISDASALNVENYLDARTEEVGGVSFKVFKPFKTKKTGDLAHIIIGPEATAHIDKMLNGRTDGPLFYDDEGKRWSARAMSVHICNTRKYALGDRVRVSAHSFRKFHTTTLEGAGVPLEWVKLLEGKSAYVYSRPQDGPELLNAYAKAYDALRILGGGRPGAEEVEELRATAAGQADQIMNQAKTMEWLINQVADLRIAVEHPERAQEIAAAKHGAEREQLEALGFIFDKRGLIKGRRPEKP